MGEGHRIDAKTPGGKAHETITVDTTVMSKYTIQSQTAIYPSRPTVLPATRIVGEVVAVIVPKRVSVA